METLRTRGCQKPRFRTSLACFLVLSSCAAVCLGEVTAPKQVAADVLTKLTAILDFEIDDKRIQTKLDSPAENQIVVTLRGDLNTPQEEEQLIETVKRVLPEAQIRRRLSIKEPEPATATDQEITELWALTYIRSRVHPTGTESQSSSAPDNIDALVNVLNEIYGLPGKPVVQRAGVGRLLLRGLPATVLEIKHFLALIDTPWPQVQMNMWAVQVSGSAEDVAQRTVRINEQVRMVRDQMQEVQRELARLVVDDLGINEGHWTPLKRRFESAGVDFPFDGPLSLNESLILLTLHPLRANKVEALQRFVHERWPAWTAQWETLAPEPYLPRRGRRAHCRTAQNDQRGRPAFSRLHSLVADTSREADLRAFIRFGESLYCFKTETAERPDSPHSLMRSGAVIDRVLKSVMDAFATDMADLFLDPLLRDLQSSTCNSQDDGIALVGRTRIVVTSGLEAGLAPEMASFVESSIAKPFGTELLDRAFPASEAGTNTTPDVLTGTSQVLAGLSNAQAIALAALLGAETQPAYTKVAPGIAINVRPSVLPDGGSARLTIDARFGVESEPQDTTRTDIWRQAPPAGIKSHNVQTDAAVSAFDLFDISSFSVTASHPQTPFYVPILGRLPVIGKAFQFPRGNKETLFESLVLVNTVILPRSIELHRFYGRNVEPQRNPELEKGCSKGAY